MKNIEEALYDLVESAVKRQVDRMHICVPGIVQKYDSRNDGKDRRDYADVYKFGNDKRRTSRN